jgi:hypothetical protein
MESARGAAPESAGIIPCRPGGTKHNYDARTFNFVARRAPPAERRVDVAAGE